MLQLSARYRVVMALCVLMAPSNASGGLDGKPQREASGTSSLLLPRRAQLDISVVPVTPPLIAMYGLPDAHGLLVHAVTPRGASDHAGLESGDVLLSLDSEPLETLEDFLALTASRRAGAVLAFHVRRRGHEFDAWVRLRALPGEAADGLSVSYGSQLVEGRLWRTITTWPDQPGRYPVVLVVDADTGESIDRPFAERVPLRDLLHGLTRAGFVTFRLDRAGRGDSQTGPMTPLGERAAFRAALAQFANDPRCDPNAMFVLATGEAASLARALATKANVQALVTLDAPAETAETTSGTSSPSCPELTIASDAWPRPADRLARWMLGFLQAGAKPSVTSGASSD